MLVKNNQKEVINMKEITMYNEQDVQNLVSIQDKKVVTTSLQVAQAFEKKHKNVIQAIENLLKEDGLKIQPMFSEDTTTDSYGRPRKIYQMNRDGFSLLAMGFTGNEALRFKLAYIEAFNRMEECLVELNRPSTLTTQQWQQLAKRVAAKYKVSSINKKVQPLSVLQILEDEERELGVDLTEFKNLLSQNVESKSNAVKLFVEERCFVEARQKVKTVELYDEYLKWSVEREGELLSNREFYQTLETLGFHKRRGARNALFIHGLATKKNQQLTLLK